MRFAIFPFHLSKVLRLPRKSDARSYEVLHLSRKIIFPKLKIWCSKMQPLSGNQRPHLLTSLMNTSLVLRIPRKMRLARSSSNVPRLPLFLESYKTLTFCSLLTRCPIPRACHAKPHLKLQKLSEHVVFLCVFDILTWKCASCHNGVHFFNTTTSKSAPNPVCFGTFWLRHVLRATTACKFFQHLNFEKCSPTCSVLYMLTSTCASRHNGVHHLNFQTWSETVSFLHFWLLRATGAWSFSSPISPDGSAPAALASLLFDPSRATNHGKTQCFATLPTFSRACIFLLLFLLTLSLLWSSFCFSSLLWVFHTSAFSSVHIVGRLTSKLPSIIISDSFGGPVIFSPSFPDARNSFRNFWLEKSWRFVDDSCTARPGDGRTICVWCDPNYRQSANKMMNLMDMMDEDGDVGGWNGGTRGSRMAPSHIRRSQGPPFDENAFLKGLETLRPNR